MKISTRSLWNSVVAEKRFFYLYFFVFIDSFSLIYILLLLYAVSKQDRERSAILSGIPVDGVVLSREIVEKKEKAREYSFYFSSSIVTTLWIIIWLVRVFTLKNTFFEYSEMIPPESKK